MNLRKMSLIVALALLQRAVRAWRERHGGLAMEASERQGRLRATILLR